MTQKPPSALVIPIDPFELYPFGDELIARGPQERMSEEVHLGILALSSLADATVALSNRLTKDARNALFLLHLARIQVCGRSPWKLRSGAGKTCPWLSQISAI
ncbi:MAG: hypothetical protein VB141_13785 [Burkholderia gladioli]